MNRCRNRGRSRRGRAPEAAVDQRAHGLERDQPSTVARFIRARGEEVEPTGQQPRPLGVGCGDQTKKRRGCSSGMESSSLARSWRGHVRRAACCLSTFPRPPCHGQAAARRAADRGVTRRVHALRSCKNGAHPRRRPGQAGERGGGQRCWDSRWGWWQAGRRCGRAERLSRWSTSGRRSSTKVGSARPARAHGRGRWTREGTDHERLRASQSI
jgi:hypothetical protein